MPDSTHASSSMQQHPTSSASNRGPHSATLSLSYSGDRSIAAICFSLITIALEAEGKGQNGVAATLSRNAVGY